MALVGRNTVTGNFIKCSDLTPDGSTKTFTLTNSKTGDNVYPGDQNSLLVSVSGVIQNPGTAYTINNNQITFTTAPSISDTIDFIVILGDLVAIGTPSDNTVTNAKIVDGTIQNAKLANNSITINGTSINLGASGTIVAGTDWQPVITADGSTATTAVAGEGYFVDTSAGSHTINLPASPTIGDGIKASLITAGNQLTIARNGNNINGSATDITTSADGDMFELVYVNASEGWKTVGQISAGTFISATGGTVTESGDYKIHTFTGDGCFVVSSLGNGASNPQGGPSTVDYAVVAGGGSGGADVGGGGGAGGFRESHSTPISGSYTASPLATPTGITVSTTTYPITVGGGGTGGPPAIQATPGSNSVFSTITSAGGGAGGDHAGENGSNGGSGGGGAGYTYTSSGGSGNTPPVSPPQGNNGGSAPSPSVCQTGGGGGGATAVGSNSISGISSFTPRASGATTSITGSPTTYAQGGRGGGDTAPGHAAGGTNTGTGGDGAGDTAGEGGATLGGSGIVIIRYKFK